MLAGGLYDFSDAELAEHFREGRRRVERFNRTPADDAAAYAAALGALIPGIPASAKIVQPFYCDLGWRIELGEEVFVNMGCTFLDCGGVRIGARTKLGPNCQLYTPQHPVDYLERRRPVETSFRITIGEDCWLGGGVVVCPGVTIGDALTELPALSRGRERRHAHHAGDDGHDAAAHAGLGRKARVEEPVARMLVETDGGHERSDVRRSGLKTVCLVTGFTPSNAMVAAATASWRAVTPIEHWRV